MRAFAVALAGAGLLVAAACGSSSSSSSAAPPAQPAPEPGGASTTASPPPAPQPPAPQPPGSPAPAPSPEPGGASTTAAPAPSTPTIRWALSAPGVFWVGMDDAAARWIATDSARAPGGDAGAPRVLRIEKRDRAGALLWAGAWTYAGPYAFSVAVTPGGEPMFLARAACDVTDVACAASIDVEGASRRGSLLVRLGTDGAVRWTSAIAGTLVGADADGGCAVAYVQAAGFPASPVLVAKLDALGRTVWTRGITAMAQFRLDRTGRVLAVGCYQDDRELVPGVPCSGLTAARFAPDGALLWTATQLGGYWPVVDTTADGSGYVAARVAPPFALTALSPDGAVRWSRRVGGGDPGFANQRGDAVAIAAAANGPVAIAGYTYRAGSTPAVLLGFDAAGNATFTDVAPFGQPGAMVYGADGELLLAVPAGGAVDTPGGHVAAPMVVELTP